MTSNKAQGGRVRKSVARRKPVIPEPSRRTIIWLAALAAVLMCGILVFDYAIGDPHLTWIGQPTAKPVNFKEPS